MKILVTGANGYIGSHVVSALLDKGCDVVACDIATNDVDKRAKIVQMDLFSEDYTDIFNRFGEPNVCLHLAWRNGFVQAGVRHHVRAGPQ